VLAFFISFLLLPTKINMWSMLWWLSLGLLSFCR
jgi:hypothetical protein